MLCGGGACDACDVVEHVVWWSMACIVGWLAIRSEVACRAQMHTLPRPAIIHAQVVRCPVLGGQEHEKFALRESSKIVNLAPSKQTSQRELGWGLENGCTRVCTHKLMPGCVHAPCFPTTTHSKRQVCDA
eukprot:1159010-Pelagomonas_calceolata.AAC.17